MSIEETLIRWACDADNVREVTSQVPDSLAEILNDQRQRLDKVDAKLPGVERYQAARQAGCLAAVAKGAKYRSLKPEQIFLPRSEFKPLNGQLRIPVFKATLLVPEQQSATLASPANVRAVTFRRDNASWYSVLEVVE